MPRRLDERVGRLLDAVGAWVLVAMTLIVFVDVVGRSFFNRPLPWGTELLEVAVGAMVFALYPVLAAGGRHITVDLIAVRPSRQVLQRRVAALVGALLFSVIALCTARQAIRSASYGDASPLLQIPTAAVLWVMCVMSGVTVLAFLIALARAGAAPGGATVLPPE